MTKAIVSTVLVQDLLHEVSPDLEDSPTAYTKALTAMLRPALNKTVHALRTPEKLKSTIDRQRQRLSIFPTTVLAFELFLANMAAAAEGDIANILEIPT